jgi:hypothetical protein
MLCIALQSRQTFFFSNHFIPKKRKVDVPAKLSKASDDSYNQRGWLMLKDLLNKWVDEGIASNPHEFKCM